MVRVNAAHGSPDERARLIDDVRAVARELEARVPILFDLQGLKIRTGPLNGDAKVPIARGSQVEIVPEPVPSGEGLIGIDFPDLLNVIQPGTRLLISDGLIELLVERVERDKAVCQVWQRRASACQAGCHAAGRHDQWRGPDSRGPRRHRFRRRAMASISSG